MNNNDQANRSNQTRRSPVRILSTFVLAIGLLIGAVLPADARITSAGTGMSCGYDATRGQGWVSDGMPQGTSENNVVVSGDVIQWLPPGTEYARVWLYQYPKDGGPGGKWLQVSTYAQRNFGNSWIEYEPHFSPYGQGMYQGNPVHTRFFWVEPGFYYGAYVELWEGGANSYNHWATYQGALYC